MINETRIYFAFPRRISNVDIRHLLQFSYFFICRYLPETKGISLEKMESVVLAKRRKNPQPIQTERYSDCFIHNADDR